MQLNGNFKYIRGIRSACHYTQNSTLYFICYGLVFTFASFIFKKLLSACNIKKTQSIQKRLSSEVHLTFHVLENQFKILGLQVFSFTLQVRRRYFSISQESLGEQAQLEVSPSNTEGDVLLRQTWHRVPLKTFQISESDNPLWEEGREKKEFRITNALTIQAERTVGNTILNVYFLILPQVNQPSLQPLSFECASLAATSYSWNRDLQFRYLEIVPRIQGLLFTDFQRILRQVFALDRGATQNNKEVLQEVVHVLIFHDPDQQVDNFCLFWGSFSNVLSSIIFLPMYLPFWKSENFLFLLVLALSLLNLF